MPTRRGRNQLEAASGLMPRRLNTKPKRAFSEAMRISIGSCMVTPMPTAAPLMGDAAAAIALDVDRFGAALLAIAGAGVIVEGLGAGREVCAGAESALAVPGDDDDLHIVVGIGDVEGLDHLVHHRAGEGVHVVRAVEGQRGNAVLDIENDFLEFLGTGHADSSGLVKLDPTRGPFPCVRQAQDEARGWGVTGPSFFASESGMDFMPLPQVTTIAAPFFVLSVALEWWAVKTGRATGRYETKDAFASIAMGVGNLVVNTLTAAVFAWLMALAWPYRIATLPMAWWTVALAFLLYDFVYYWKHRFSHQVRWFWMEHVTHHSSEHYNLTTALRQPWFGPFTGLILLGVPMVL